eukprot:scaffold60_cov325-Pavlova_lutheri.AAC.20
MFHQLIGMLVAHHDGVYVHGGQRVPGRREHATRIVHPGKGRDPGADPPFHLLFRQQASDSQFAQRLSTQHGAQEQAVWLEHVSDLLQRTGQVVRPVHA